MWAQYDVRRVNWRSRTSRQSDERTGDEPVIEQSHADPHCPSTTISRGPGVKGHARVSRDNGDKRPVVWRHNQANWNTSIAFHLAFEI